MSGFIPARNPITQAKWRQLPSSQPAYRRVVMWAWRYRRGLLNLDNLTSADREAVQDYLVTHPRKSSAPPEQRIG